MEPNPQLGDIAHLIQVALTPVFLISGIAALLNVFNTRLARVSDHSEHLNELLRGDAELAETELMRRQLARLHRRTTVLDISIVLGAIGAAATCAAAFALFVVTARDSAGGLLLTLLFGGALAFTVGALTAFVVDSVLAWHGIRMEGPLPPARKTS